MQRQSHFIKILLFLFGVFSPLFSAAGDTITPEIREQVVQELLQEARAWDEMLPPPRKRVLMGRFVGTDHQLVLQSTDEGQLKKHLQFQNWNSEDQQSFLNTRSVALAGLSAGGILYFLPDKKYFFWEVSEEALVEGDFQDGLWTSPVIGNILSSLLKNLQRDLKSKKRLMGSQKFKSFMMAVLNPSDFIARKIWKQKLSHNGKALGRTDLLTEAPMTESLPSSSSKASSGARPAANYIGLHFEIRF